MIESMERFYCLYSMDFYLQRAELASIYIESHEAAIANGNN